VLILAATRVFYPSTRFMFFLLIVLAVVNPKLRPFVVDFSPFIVLILTYNTLRSFADNLSPSDIHITDLIEWEQALGGGTLPSYWMQQNLWGRWFTPVLDVIANGFYLSHFLTPVLAAGAFWRHRRSTYWSYALGLVVLSYAGFLTYILFPAAPPWWATFHGYLPDQPVTLSHFIVNEETVNAGPNPVAAMPSLHVAYPTYIALVAVFIFGRKALPVFLLPVGVALSAAYLGHHYLIDGLAGAGYALFFFSTVFMWLYRRNFSIDWFGKRVMSQRDQPHTSRHSEASK
jgi:membrane-associated phospholipid phosphatase